MSAIGNKFKSIGRKLRRYAIGVFREIKRIRWPKGKDLVKGKVVALFLAAFISFAAVLAVTGLTAQFFIRLNKKKEESQCLPTSR